MMEISFIVLGQYVYYPKMKYNFSLFNLIDIVNSRLSFALRRLNTHQRLIPSNKS